MSAGAKQPDYPPIKCRLKAIAFLDYRGGGWGQIYGDEALGISKVVARKTRSSEIKVVYLMKGDEKEYTDIAEFTAAYWTLYPDRLAAELKRLGDEAKP